jgi:hypothetical protein
MMPAVPVAKLTNPLCSIGGGELDSSGEPQAQPGANSITVADLEVRAVQARHLIDDREAKAAAAARSIGHTIEALANRLSLILRNPGAIVLNREVCTAVGHATAYRHVSTGRHVANGIVDEIHEHLANQPWDTGDLHRLDLCSEIDTFEQRPIEVPGYHILDELATVEGGEFVREMHRGICACERQQLIGRVCEIVRTLAESQQLLAHISLSPLRDQEIELDQ